MSSYKQEGREGRRETSEERQEGREGRRETSKDRGKKGGRDVNTTSGFLGFHIMPRFGNANS